MGIGFQREKRGDVTRENEESGVSQRKQSEDQESVKRHSHNTGEKGKGDRRRRRGGREAGSEKSKF